MSHELQVVRGVFAAAIVVSIFHYVADTILGIAMLVIAVRVALRPAASQRA